MRKAGSSQNALATSDARIAAGVVRRNPLVTIAAAAAIVLAVGGATYLVFRPETTTHPPAAAAVPPNYTIRQLTTTGTAVSPALSPNGQFVVYAERGDTVAPSGGLFMRQVATSTSVPIVEPEPGVFVFGPTVTPDSTYVDYIRQEDGRLTDAALWRTTLLGGERRRIAADVWGPVGWAADGQQMAFLRYDFATNSSLLIVANPDGSGQRVVARRDSPEDFPVLALRPWTLGALVRPAWSPDGNTIAMFESTVGDATARVAFIDVATGQATVRDTHAALDVRGLAWLSLTSLVLSQAENLGGRLQLWRMSYPDGTVTPLTNDLSSYIGVDVDGQRRTLVTARREARASVAVGGATDAQLEEVVPPVPFGAQPASLVWAGERLIYGSAVNGRPAVAAIPIDGGTPQHLISDAYSVDATSDGETIVFIRDSVDGLWRADGSGGGLTQLVGGDAADPLVLPGDRTVMFVRAGTESLWSVPISGGEAQQVVTNVVGSQGFDVSRDGRRLAFRLSGEPPTTVVCDMPACTNRHTLSSNPPPSFRWMPDGERIAYVDSGQGGIWSAPIEGGEPSNEYTGATAKNRIVAFAWSRDGERLAVIQQTISDDIVLFGNLSE